MRSTISQLVILLALTACQEATPLEIASENTEPQLTGSSFRGTAPHPQWVLLKADDITCCPMSDGWRRFASLIQERHAAAGLGLIGQSLEGPTPDYLRFLRRLARDPSFEFWNHGYDHACQPPTFWEFRFTNYEQQRSHLARTQQLARLRLGVVLRAFGAPCNAIDSITTLAVAAEPTLRIWLYGREETDKILIPWQGQAEFPTHYPDAEQFVASYDADAPFLVLQIHPGGWDEARFAEFARILDFLDSQHTQFVTPTALGRIIQALTGAGAARSRAYIHAAPVEPMISWRWAIGGIEADNLVIRP